MNTIIRKFPKKRLQVFREIPIILEDIWKLSKAHTTFFLQLSNFYIGWKLVDDKLFVVSVSAFLKNEKMTRGDGLSEPMMRVVAEGRGAVGVERGLFFIPVLSMKYRLSFKSEPNLGAIVV